MIKLVENLSIRKKVLYSTLIIFVLIGILSSVAYWFIAIPAITEQIKAHSLRVAESLVTRCRPFILSDDRPQLTGILFQKKSIEKDLLYIFVRDAQNRIIAHTFIPNIPEGIETANLMDPFEEEKITLLTVRGQSVYDAAISVRQGLKIIGTVHIGVGKRPVDAITFKMGIIFIIVMIIIIMLAAVLGNLTANYISRPLLKLTKAMDDLCMGRTDQLPQFTDNPKCWDILNCNEKKCPAFQDRDSVCWLMNGTICHGKIQPPFPEKMKDCYQCDVYKKLGGDEIVQISNSFSNIIYTLQLKTNEIRKSEEKYRLLFHYDPNPLFVVEMKSAKITDANRRATETYQYSVEEFKNMSLFDLLHVDDAKRFKINIQDFKEKDYFFLPKLWTRKKDGKQFFIDLHARASKIQENDLTRPDVWWIIRTVDITQRLEQESQLIQAGKMATLGEMATGIAHELNQPLNVIKVGSDFFKKMISKGNKISDDQLLTIIRNIGNQVERATDIINHLREFGRKVDFKMYPTDINEPIRDVFRLLGEQLRLRDIEVRLDLDERLPKVMADKNRLEQIFLNLATNARDSLEAKDKNDLKQLIITTTQEKGNVVVLFSDTGTGMTQDVREKIFEPFFTTKETGKGTGLGLSITYNLVKDFAGDVDVLSTSKKGTTFRLTFPTYRIERNKDEQTSAH